MVAVVVGSGGEAGPGSEGTGLTGTVTVGNGGAVEAEATPWQGHAWSAGLVLPPLAALVLKPEDDRP